MIRLPTTRIAVATLAALPLAACGGEPPAANQTAAAPQAIGNDAQAIIDLPKGQREGVLYRAIADGKAEGCPSVVDSAREADTDGQPTWSARCADGETFLVVVGPDGVAKVRRVTQAR